MLIIQNLIHVTQILCSKIFISSFSIQLSVSVSMEFLSVAFKGSVREGEGGDKDVGLTMSRDVCILLRFLCF